MSEWRKIVGFWLGTAFGIGLAGGLPVLAWGAFGLYASWRLYGVLTPEATQ